MVIDARFLKSDLSSRELALQLPGGQHRINRPQRKALDRIGELVPIRHRQAVPPPRIALDGRDIGTSWTRMWFEVAPGPHRIDVRTPESPLPVPGGGGETDRRVFTFDSQVGQVVRIGLVVSVTAVPDPDHATLHRWECRIDRLGPQPVRAGAEAPRADVRGGIRRDLTGRYWETRDDVPPSG